MTTIRGDPDLQRNMKPRIGKGIRNFLIQKVLGWNLLCKDAFEEMRTSAFMKKISLRDDCEERNR